MAEHRALRGEVERHPAVMRASRATTFEHHLALRHEEVEILRTVIAQSARENVGLQRGCRQGAALNLIDGPEQDFAAVVTVRTGVEIAEPMPVEEKPRV